MNLPSNTEDDGSNFWNIYIGLRKEVDLLYKKLSYYLDNLSNLSFTPKPFTEEAKIIKNVSSIKLEEKIPIFMSKAN